MARNSIKPKPVVNIRYNPPIIDTTQGVSDPLQRLGKNISRTGKEISDTTRYISQNHPQVERCEDLVGILYNYRMEFVTYTDSPIVHLDITFFPRYRNV